MKKKKIRWWELIGEIVGELVITLVFFGVGALVIGAFGVDIDAEKMDGDLLVLIGIVAFAVLGAVGYGVYRLLKHKKTDETRE